MSCLRERILHSLEDYRPETESVKEVNAFKNNFIFVHPPKDLGPRFFSNSLKVKIFLTVSRIY